MSNEREMTVDGVSVLVRVVKTGKVTYRAYAKFRGKHVDQTGSSESSALDRWRRKAEYLSDD